MKANSLLVLLVGLLSGCTTSVTVEGTVPTPLVAKLPANVAVFYSEKFKNFQHEEVIDRGGTFKVDFGEQNLSFFRNLMNAMFETATEVPEAPLPPEKMAMFDGLVVPEIMKYGFLTPSVSGLNFYSASIHYRVLVYDADGATVGDWTIVGYGKAEGGAFAGEDALEEATLLAIRDGGARIAIDLPAEPSVVAWVQRHQPADSGGVE